MASYRPYDLNIIKTDNKTAGRSKEVKHIENTSSANDAEDYAFEGRQPRQEFVQQGSSDFHDYPDFSMSIGNRRQQDDTAKAIAENNTKDMYLEAVDLKISKKNVTDTRIPNSDLVSNINLSSLHDNQDYHSVEVIKEKSKENLNIGDMIPSQEVDLQNAIEIANVKVNDDISDAENGRKVPEEEQKKQKLQYLFVCNICRLRLNQLKNLLDHYKESHSDIQIPEDLKVTLYNQRRLILKVEITAMELISAHKVKAAQSLLDSSRISFDGFKTQQGDIGPHVFEKFIRVMYSRVHKLIKRKLKILSKRHRPIKTLNIHKGKTGFEISNRVKKIPSGSEDFSSDDNLCLKDSVLKFKMEEIVSGTESCDGEACMLFYAIPEKTDGEKLSCAEMSAIRNAISNAWSDRPILETDFFRYIRIIRFEKETDEIVPDDAILIGYASKMNGINFESKPFLSLFNERGLLDDDVIRHCKNDGFDDSVTLDMLNSNILSSDDEVVVTATYEEKYNIDECISLSDSSENATRQIDSPYHKRKKRSLNKETCQFCGEHFRLKRNLKLHIAEEHESFCKIEEDRGDGDSEQKKFQCKICGERFAYKGRLLQHEIKMHSELKPYECEACHERFRTAEKRDKHFDSHEKKGHLSCGVCNENFVDSKTLKNHFKAVHSNKSSDNGFDDGLEVDLKQEPGEDNTVEGFINRNTKKVKFSKDSDDAPECKICGRRFTSLGRLTQHTSISHEGGTFVRRKNGSKAKRKNTKSEDTDEIVNENICTEVV